MNDEDLFEVVGAHDAPQGGIVKAHNSVKDKPIGAFLIFGIIFVMCMAAEAIMTKNPCYMDLSNCNVAPCREFLFGTDTLGRDVFSMIWYGGRCSIAIGLTATAISTFIGVVFGAVSGISKEWTDNILMRLTEILLSVPSLLFVILLQAMLKTSNIFTISLVIGLTSWTSIAKVVRTEVRRMRSSDFVVASKCMGGGFFHVLWRHLTPNFVSSIMFMVVMNVRSAIVAESTLSFLGVGLPIEIITWGSMLSMSERAMNTRSWWIMIIPGLFMVILVVCLTEIGNWVRKSLNQNQRVL